MGLRRTPRQPDSSDEFHLAHDEPDADVEAVILWENSNRYCSDGSDNACTLINPAVYTEEQLCCAPLGEGSGRLHDNCQWKTQNVTVENNTMVGTACTVANLCGFNGLFSNYGTSRYNQKGPITFRQDN